jgi:hypothetical protein
VRAEWLNGVLLVVYRMVIPSRSLESERLQALRGAAGYRPREFGLTKPQGTKLPVGCTQPPRRPILCRRHSERGFEQSAEMGGIIETPPIGDLGYVGLGIRSV